MFNEQVYKMVLSKPKKSQTDLKRIEIAKNDSLYQASMYGTKKITHKNMNYDEVKDFVNENFVSRFLQFNAWDQNLEFESKASRKGKVISSCKPSKNPPKRPVFTEFGFDRLKNHIIKEGDEIHALVDMGVFTKNFTIINDKRKKFIQINRFLEIIEDEMQKHCMGVSIIDIGCGKSYLTFLLHHYFTKIQGFEADICGLDSDTDLINKCRETAEKYGCQQLSFFASDIKQLKLPPIDSFGTKNRFSIAICLHACDTATDYAILHAVDWGADLILAAPCCQHELADQVAPKNLTIFKDYGIIRERFSSLATDLVRAKVLESCGYSVQIIEFTGFQHTEKNLLIRARKTGYKNASALTDINKLCDEFGFSPAILNIGR